MECTRVLTNKVFLNMERVLGKHKVPSPNMVPIEDGTAATKAHVPTKKKGNVTHADP